MTVSELIQILIKLPQDEEVRVYPPDWYSYEYVGESEFFYDELTNTVEIG